MRELKVREIGIAGSNTTESAEGADFTRIAWALAGVVAPLSRSGSRRKHVGETPVFNRSHYCREQTEASTLSATSNTLEPGVVIVPIRGSTREAKSSAALGAIERTQIQLTSAEEIWTHWSPQFADLQAVFADSGWDRDYMRG
jgi:hypothetical protein